MVIAHQIPIGALGHLIAADKCKQVSAVTQIGDNRLTAHIILALSALNGPRIMPPALRQNASHIE
ncbi:hypothetical protein ROG8370_00942 [Roseovarius gaetbuli]|uniref:Uncharacterized protein n=1 Tax=Roseovarius gaetbuli TaxID=1356575 RepID=A0A1X6YN13_9RHOB|nr:hypothetical protein ROG8370_00942 [Roseovarius gaetbuli]